MTPLSVVCWKWNAPGYRSSFGPETVNALRAMVDWRYRAPHQVICVTNDPAGIDADVRIVPDRADFADLVSPHGRGNPACYRRLRLFEPDAAEIFGPRVVSIDLDVVLVADVRPLWDRPEDFVGWQDPMHPEQLCGSMWLLRTGSRPQVWEDFDPQRSPAIAREAGFRGSDQAWLSHQLAARCARWRRSDGVLSWRQDLQNGMFPLPPTARVVMFHGAMDPWGLQARRVRWVRENWGATASA